MKSKIFEPIISFIVAVIFLSGVTVFADEQKIDLSKCGSISVTLAAEDITISGAEFSIYRICDAAYKENFQQISFTYTDEYSSFGINPKNIKTADDIYSLVNFTAENKIGFYKSGQTDSSGFLKFDNLPVGAYLVTQTGGIEGFSDCSPFIAFVPSEENGNAVFDIDASPKTDISRLVDVSVRKVWNDDRDSHSGNITIRLFNGNEVVDTVVLNSGNNWFYKWNDIPKSDSYRVEELDVPANYVAAYSSDGFDFTVTNSSVLIQTGRNKILVWILGISGAILFVIGWLRFNNGKNKNAEE